MIGKFYRSLAVIPVLYLIMGTGIAVVSSQDLFLAPVGVSEVPEALYLFYDLEITEPSQIQAISINIVHLINNAKLTDDPQERDEFLVQAEEMADYAAHSLVKNKNLKNFDQYVEFIIACYTNLAENYRRLGKTGKVEPILTKASSLIEEFPEAPRVAEQAGYLISAKTNLAVKYRLQNELDKAKVQLQET